VPKLGEVLGSLLTDVVRARHAADALTVQAVEAYRADPVLSSMTVPHVTVSDMTVHLRFLVNEVVVPEPPPIDPGRIQEEWNRLVRDRILTRLAGRRDDVGRIQIEQMRQELLVNPIPIDTAVAEAVIAGKGEVLGDVSIGTIVDLVRAVPLRARRSLGTIPDVREELRREIAAGASQFVTEVQERQTAQQALRSRIDIDVVSGQLQTAAAHSVQELDVTVSLADVETFLDTDAGA
jgi:hypothetical protein